MRNDQRLGTEPIGRLMVQMAVPAVAAQLINVLYNIAQSMVTSATEKSGKSTDEKSNK